MKKIFLFFFCASIPIDSLAQDFQQILKRTPADLEVRDAFGSSVDISGDIAIVGAPNNDEFGSNSGAAYIFYLDGENGEKWQEIAKLTASDAAEDDRFGRSVSIFGHFAIVGAFTADSTDTGAAYIFHKDSGGVDNWGEVSKLTASDAMEIDFFGYSVSISQDYAVVGSYLDDEKETNSGTVYVFKKPTTKDESWNEIAKLHASDAIENGRFGLSVSISQNEILIGAIRDTEKGVLAGAAYIFTKNDESDSWQEIKILSGSNTGTEDRFGSSVDIFGDYAVVGSYNGDGNEEDSGVAFLFYRNEGGANNWGEVKRLQGSDVQFDERFGFSVSLSNDFLVVGAHLENKEFTSAGAAYVFYKNENGPNAWGEVGKIVAPDPIERGRFGVSVASSNENIVIGADQQNTWIPEGGAAYFMTKALLINNESLASPSSITLDRNYPNPFNPTSIISFYLPQASEVKLQVFDITGRLVSTLVNEKRIAGSHSVQFEGSTLSSGVYFYRLEAGDFVSTRKMTLIK